jgi:imidazole glycerol phosphate synthase glutamine amidotransferase subunit
MIGLLDYGAGNLRSVQNALDQIGASYEVVRDVAGLDRSSRIILPGVGHFGQMMRALREMDVREALLQRLAAGIPFLGICLGLHALFERSTEAPEATGLGLFPGNVRRFPAGARVPHMGWNNVTVSPSSRLFDSSSAEPYLYFAHSYFVPLCQGATASCTYGEPFVAAFERENIFGVQFHPEKSGPAGLAMLQRFVRL